MPLFGLRGTAEPRRCMRNVAGRERGRAVEGGFFFFLFLPLTCNRIPLNLFRRMSAAGVSV